MPGRVLTLFCQKLHIGSRRGEFEVGSRGGDRDSICRAWRPAEQGWALFLGKADGRKKIKARIINAGFSKWAGILDHGKLLRSVPIRLRRDPYRTGLFAPLAGEGLEISFSKYGINRETFFCLRVALAAAAERAIRGRLHGPLVWCVPLKGLSDHSLAQLDRNVGSMEFSISRERRMDRFLNSLVVFRKGFVEA